MKAYENRWGMYCDGDAGYYQRRAREWFLDAQSDLELFSDVLHSPVARELISDTLNTATDRYSRARFCMGLRAEDYDGQAQ